MDRRTLLAVGAGALGIVIVGYAVFAPANDEELIAQVLEELGDGLSYSEPIGNPLFFGSRLSETFQDVFTEQIDIRLAEISRKIPSDRGKLGFATAQLLVSYGSLNVAFGALDIEVQGDFARAQADATVTGTYHGEVRREVRPVQFDLTRADGDWRIQAARVAPAP